MLKKFRKVTILALALVMIISMSANAFAATSFRELWYANDQATNVVAYAEIEAYRTYGGISTSTRSGEAYAALVYEYYIGDPENPNNWDDSILIEDIGTDEAYVDSGDTGAYAMGRASYEFYAWVQTLEGDDTYSPDIVELEYPYYN